MPFRIFETEAHSILSPVSGFLAGAGFTHSLSPSRNCTFGCTYCYVPTMRIRAGLRRDDWMHWGQFTTFKANSAELLGRELNANQTIYCSPLTDPYQPAEAQQNLMPAILRAVIDRPPRVFVIQTRGPLILRDLELVIAASRVTRLRVSFSITTDREDVRHIFEPHCASLQDRWNTIATLRAARVETVATLAPLLPCNPEALVTRALDATTGPIVADPLHVRAAKPTGAQTRDAAHAICQKYGWGDWLDPSFQNSVLCRMRSCALQRSRSFGWGPSGFAELARPQSLLSTPPGTESQPSESYNVSQARRG